MFNHKETGGSCDTLKAELKYLKELMETKFRAVELIEGRMLVERDVLKEFLLLLINERDRQYKERFEAYKEATTKRHEAYKESVRIIIGTQKEELVAALLAAEKAIAKAEIASDKRFESVNEFRNTLADQQRTFMPRAEIDVIAKSLQEKIDANAARLLIISSESKGSIDVLDRAIPWIIAIASIIIGFISHFVKY